MTHSFDLIATLAGAFGLALILGFIALRLKLPALVGYLVAGIIIGPYTPGFIADIGLSQQLAEIGVILLMFGVGLHFSLDDLLSVRHIALPGAVAQIAVATALGAGVATLWGWSLGASIVFGLALSVASTVVLIRALEARGLLESINGHIAIGWLVVEDLVMILVLIVLPPLAGWLSDTTASTAQVNSDLLTALVYTLGKVALFIALMLVLGRRIFPWILWHVARTGSRELFTLCVIAAALGIAYGAAMIFGVSFALGAFFAGMMLRESALSHRAADESLPLRDAFSVLFFVSVGMLFNPLMLIEEPLRVLAVVMIILFGKTLAAFVLVLAFRYPLNTALTVSASLAQIGEFSFILAGLGVTLNVLPAEGQSLILAGALISIALNPLMFNAIEPIQNWIRARSKLARAMERPGDPLAELPMTINQEHLTGHVLLVGHGRIGSQISKSLLERGIPMVVAEQNRELVEHLRARNIAAVSGDASDPAVLIQAHVARAHTLVITAPDAFKARQMIEIARMLNPAAKIFVLARNAEEAELLRKEQANQVFMAEEELAHAMTQQVLTQIDDSAHTQAMQNSKTE